MSPIGRDVVQTTGRMVSRLFDMSTVVLHNILQKHNSSNSMDKIVICVKAHMWHLGGSTLSPIPYPLSRVYLRLSSTGMVIDSAVSWQHSAVWWYVVVSMVRLTVCEYIYRIVAQWH